MKEQDITPKVIELARKITKHWRMEIYEGCWVFLRWPTPFLVRDEHSVEWAIEQNAIPIPSISDCLEKLLELGYESMNLQRRPLQFPWMTDIWDKESHDLEADTIKRWRNKDETLHEVLFSVLLKALKEEK